MTASETVTLEAAVTAGSYSAIIIQKIIVAEPELNAQIIAPEYIGLKPFDAVLKLENTGEVDILITCDFMGEVTNVSLQTGQERVIKRTLSSMEDIKITANISGDVILNIEKNVSFGESAAFDITAEAEYPEGHIEVPFTVTNVGQVEMEIKAEVRSQNSEVRMMEYYIPAGESVSGAVQYELLKGEYQLSYAVASLQSPVTKFDSGKVQFIVKKYNDLEINAAADSNTSDGKINVTVDINNIGLNDFLGMLLIESSFSKNEEEINIAKDRKSVV